MTPLLATLIGFTAMLIGLGVSIAAHELGHLIPAKLFGVKVSKYMIGMGPTIWSKQSGETLYGIKALPVGGFCTMLGMLPPAPATNKDKNTFFGKRIANARKDSVKEIKPGEENRTFYNLSAPKKLIVMAGGILTNLLLVIIFVALMFTIGITAPTTTIDTVANCIPDVQPCSLTPARLAGLQTGDKIVSIGGKPVTNWGSFTENIQHASPNQHIPLQIIRNNETINLTITPLQITRTTPNSSEKNSEIYLGLKPITMRQTIPLQQVPGTVQEMFTGTVGIVTSFPVQVYQVAHNIVTGNQRSTDSLMSVVGMGRIAGEITGASNFTVLDRVALMLNLLASLNMALFVFNLAPLLPLDGGHVLNALYEGAKRTLARLRGIQPLPGPADVARTLPISYVMVVVLVSAGGLLIVADLIDPVRLL